MRLEHGRSSREPLRSDLDAHRRRRRRALHPPRRSRPRSRSTAGTWRCRRSPWPSSSMRPTVCERAMTCRAAGSLLQQRRHAARGHRIGGRDSSRGLPPRSSASRSPTGAHPAPANIDRSAWHEGLADYCLRARARRGVRRGLLPRPGVRPPLPGPLLQPRQRRSRRKANAIVDALIERGHRPRRRESASSRDEIALEDRMLRRGSAARRPNRHRLSGSTLERYRVREPMRRSNSASPATLRSTPLSEPHGRWGRRRRGSRSRRTIRARSHVTVTGTSGFEDRRPLRGRWRGRGREELLLQVARPSR